MEKVAIYMLIKIYQEIVEKIYKNETVLKRKCDIMQPN